MQVDDAKIPSYGCIASSLICLQYGSCLTSPAGCMYKVMVVSVNMRTFDFGLALGTGSSCCLLPEGSNGKVYTTSSVAESG